MGILTAVLSVVSAIFGAVCSAVSWIFKTMPPLGWLLLGVLLIGLYLGRGCVGVPTGCSLRELACGCRPRPPRPTRWDSYSVVSVTTGVSIEVKAGLAGKRTRTITLASVACPLSPDLAEQSRASLEALAGKTVRVEHHGLFSGTPNEQQSTPGQDSQRRLETTDSEATAEAPEARGLDDEVCPFCGGVEIIPTYGDGKTPGEAMCPHCRGPIVGQVFGESGADLAVAQAAAGMVTVNDGASKELKAAEAKAHAKKIGLWATNE